MLNLKIISHFLYVERINMWICERTGTRDDSQPEMGT